ncbi:hypothetical protein D9756_003623 [Leucocoprinus leucothites]|uniref:Enoyl reductase (ER) domain-containing protein n=1 Tax=Leucocoprinus leucothites TaxID=201217 RepID=A0A8H5G729_9AGAR|nr:hypothetical protein D9756_003623 [Leucoagaricus leucothites]
MSPESQKALFLDSKQGKFVVTTHVVPRPGAAEISIRVKACGLNPIDWKIQRYGVFVESYPIVLGVDIAGDVVEVGGEVVGFSMGDRVVAHGVFSNTASGFQQYVLGIPESMAKLPPNVSYDQAASFPSTLGAAFLSLYNQKPHGLGFSSPTKSDAQGKYSGTPLVILGGATIVGQYAIQLAKLSGFSPIIVTSSLIHESLLKEYGADKVIDRYSTIDTLRDQISVITLHPIQYVLDAVSMPATQQMANGILAPGGYLQLVQAPEALFSPDKHVQFTKGIRGFPESKETFAMLYQNLHDLFANAHIRPCPVEVVPGGLAGIPSGIARLEKDEVSGFKLVARPDETP